MNRTVLTQFWTDPRVRELPAEGKLLFIYCITSPLSHVSGVYYLPDLLVAQETGLGTPKQCTPDTVSGGHVAPIQRWWELLRVQNLVLRDSKNEVVWVVNMLRHQRFGGARNSKLTTAVKKQLKTLHNSPLVKEMHHHYKLPFSLQEIGYKQCTPDTVSGGHVAPIPSGNELPKYSSILGTNSSAQSDVSTTAQAGQPKTAAPAPTESAKKGRKKPDKTSEPKQPRPRDPIWDAVAEITSSDPDVSAAHIGKVVKLLKGANPPYTAEEILRLPEAIRAAGWDFVITPGVIEKHIGRVRKLPPRNKPQDRQDSHCEEKRNIVPMSLLGELFRQTDGEPT